jgi:hypothetical protein
VGNADFFNPRRFREVFPDKQPKSYRKRGSAMQRTDKALWGLVAALVGICFVTMILPALLAAGGGYLLATGNYLIAALLVAAAGGTGYWAYCRRRAQHGQPRQRPGTTPEHDAEIGGATAGNADPRQPRDSYS